jgi:two-component system phosphate regulon response regulator PhoB
MQRILSLDAETEVLDLLQAILERAGYEHIRTYSNDEALKILQIHKIDLITQNIMRPKANGCEFYQTLQADETLKGIPILIITPLNPFALPKVCWGMVKDLYPDHYICMPFSPHELLSIVRRTLDA